MIKRLKMKCKYFLFSFFSCPFSLFSSSLILIFLYLSVVFLSCVLPLKDQHLSITYSSLTLTIYKENILTHQASLKKLICEKNVSYIARYDNFLATSKQVLLPVISFLAVSVSNRQSHIISKLQKCIFRILQIL